MLKLSDHQRSLLDAVASAPLQTICIDDIDGKPGVLMTSARALARRGLITIAEGEGNAGSILYLTDNGRALCRTDTEDVPAGSIQKPCRTTKHSRPGTAVPPAKTAKEPSAPATEETDEASGRRPTKKAVVMHLLSRKDGASIAELQIATGWQAHSIRAVLTGFRKDGHTLTRERFDGAPSIYRIVEAAR